MSPLTQILVVAGIAMQASAATVKITVGQNGFVFTPNEVKANVGDVLEFHYVGGNHSVVQGDFDNPCQPVTTGGFFSGYFPATNGENPNVFSVTVNDTNPIAFYCSQAKHCPSGMVGVVNPTNASSYANYAGAAKNAQSVTAPATVFGGVVGPAPASTTSGGSPDATSSSTASPPASTTKSDAGTLSVSLSAIVAAIGFAVYLA